ncbi:MAG TPA: bifunctional UDP-sugar hydrolase/5'-nucleotidase [Nitrospiraceae bacterium]|nr:bifunctional UDP-sugar hydrolase/5'-nucleotidase [Nitrospiraceae bacterium]
MPSHACTNPGWRTALLIFFLLFDSLSAAEAPTLQNLTILHTSEHHGSVLPFQRQDEGSIGGMARRASLIAQIRQEIGPVLLVDSGDILIGTAFSSFFKGEPDVLAMNLMGYQAMAAGNHDFDYGLDHLHHLQRIARFPILCSNVTGHSVEVPCRPYAIVRVGSTSIGLIGLLGRSNFPDAFNRQAAAQLAFRDGIEAARTLSRALKTRGDVDLVIAVTHQDTEEDMSLLQEVPDVDVIIGGHTEGFDGLRTVQLPSPTTEEVSMPGAVFVKTHRQGRTIGRLDLRIAEGKVRWAKAGNWPVSAGIVPDAAIEQLVGRYAEELEQQTGKVLGEALVDLDGESTRIRSQETNFGNLMADLLRKEFRTEIALLNSGQIRGSIPAGPVILRQVLGVLPFDSSTVTLMITGRELSLALENSVSRLPQIAGRFLQVSGLTVSYDLSASPGSRVREVFVGEQPLDVARRYSVATDAFLADGGDGFTMFSAATNRIERQIPLRDLLISALSMQPLAAARDGRLRFR